MQQAQDASTAGATPTTTDADTPAEPAGNALADANNALLVKLAVASRKSQEAQKAEKAAKKEVVEAFRRGATQVAADPRKPDEEIAQITVSKVTWSAQALDRAAVDEWVKAKYADKAEKKVRIICTDEDVLNIMRTFAPYYLEEVHVVPDHVIRELELKSEVAHQPMGWGGEIGDDAPPGIAVTPSDPKITITWRNADLVDDLIVGGVVDMDGNLIAGESR